MAKSFWNKAIFIVFLISTTKKGRIICFPHLLRQTLGQVLQGQLAPKTFMFRCKHSVPVCDLFEVLSLIPAYWIRFEGTRGTGRDSGEKMIISKTDFEEEVVKGHQKLKMFSPIQWANTQACRTPQKYLNTIEKRGRFPGQNWLSSLTNPKSSCNKNIQFSEMIPGQPQRTRKGLNSLSGPQKEQYYFLMRCLHIFTPKSEDQFQFKFNNWYSKNVNPQRTKPKCLYDALVSIHANSCEHMSEFFAYWHRYLMFRFERLLGEASKNVLDSNYLTQESKRIYQIIPENRQKLTNPNQILALLTQMKKDYESIVSKLGAQASKTVACHYWEFFNDQSNTNYPDGFISREKYYENSFKAADELIRVMWDQDSIYEINFATRYDYKPAYDLTKIWISKTQYDECLSLQNHNNFWKNPEKHPDLIYRATQLKELRVEISSGEKTVPSLASQYFFFKQCQYRKSSSDETQTQYVVYLDPRKIRFNVFDQKEVTLFFGGGEHPFFNIYKLGAIKDKVYKFKDLRNQEVGFNAYGRALHTLPQEFANKFCTSNNDSTNFSMETPHNALHNYQKYTMGDGKFSIINPIFMAFHGTIDLMLEYRIQTFNKQEKKAAGESLRQFLDTKVNLKKEKINFRGRWARYMYMKNGKWPKYGDYPITVFIDPNIAGEQNRKGVVTDNNFKVATQFTYSQIMLTSEGSVKTLEEFSGSSFENIKNNTFAKVVERTRSPIPYSQHNMYVAYEIIFPPEVRNENIYVEFSDKNGWLLTKVLPIFKRAGDCPNCNQNQPILLAVPVEEFGGKYTDVLKSGMDGLEINNFFNNQIKLKISHPKAQYRMKTGRDVFEFIIYPDKKGKEEIPPTITTTVRLQIEKIKDREDLQKTHLEDVEKTITLTYNPVNQVYESGPISFEDQEFRTLEVMRPSTSQAVKFTNMRFPLFAWNTKIEINEITKAQSIPAKIEHITQNIRSSGPGGIKKTQQEKQEKQESQDKKKQEAPKIYQEKTVEVRELAPQQNLQDIAEMLSKPKLLLTTADLLK